MSIYFFHNIHSYVSGNLSASLLTASDTALEAAIMVRKKGRLSIYLLKKQSRPINRRRASNTTKFKPKVKFILQPRGLVEISADLIPLVLQAPGALNSTSGHTLMRRHRVWPRHINMSWFYRGVNKICLGPGALVVGISVAYRVDLKYLIR